LGAKLRKVERKTKELVHFFTETENFLERVEYFVSKERSLAHFQQKPIRIIGYSK